MHRVLDRARAIVRQDNRNIPALRRCAADLAVLRKELQQARLGEGATFAEATQRIKAWFGPYEARVQSAQEYLAGMLANLEMEQTSDTKEMPRQPALPALTESGRDPSSADNTTSDQHSQAEITAVDRDTVDLEALRPYLTDYSLLIAAKRHLAEKGPGTLKGAEYGLKVLQEPPADQKVLR
ncbi:hypothetical protein IV417_08340 [Alphaproteobacteria bacterium KMM 3653]|uniref:Uncharacterized protein n=1 Tax=Harenicola maris TaxID=2841044 RepID=A0AAP2CQJ1_9RHOB|nr:hypothetical protein [Harenicola maris]